MGTPTDAAFVIREILRPPSDKTVFTTHHISNPWQTSRTTTMDVIKYLSHSWPPPRLDFIAKTGETGKEDKFVACYDTMESPGGLHPTKLTTAVAVEASVPRSHWLQLHADTPTKLRAPLVRRLSKEEFAVCKVPVHMEIIQILAAKWFVACNYDMALVGVSCFTSWLAGCSGCAVSIVVSTFRSSGILFSQYISSGCWRVIISRNWRRRRLLLCCVPLPVSLERNCVSGGWRAAAESTIRVHNDGE